MGGTANGSGEAITEVLRLENLEIGVSTKLIVTAYIKGNVLREKKILKKKNFEEKKL